MKTEEEIAKEEKKEGEKQKGMEKEEISGEPTISIEGETLEDLKEAHEREEAEAEAETQPEEEKTSPAVSLISSQSLEKLYQMVFGIVAGRTGQKKWELTQIEAKCLGDLTDPVMSKYMPAMFDRFGEELALASAVSMILAERMMKPDEQPGSDNSDSR